MNLAGKIVLGIVLGAALLAIIALLSLSGAEQTPKEATLTAIILALFSIIAAWAITHWYASQNLKSRIEEINKTNLENIRMFGLKAAEKLTNSSNELTRLNVYLEQTLAHEEDDYKLAITHI